MSGVGEGEKLGARAVAQAFVSHFGQEEGVAFAPKDARGDANGLVRKFGASAEERAVPVNHAGEGAGLRPCSAVLGEIFSAEGPWAAGAQKRARADAEVESGENAFRQPGELKEEHVPAMEELARTRAEEFAHHGRMRNVEDNEFGDALRMKQGGAPGDGGAPIMSGEKDFFLAELIGDIDDVGDEFRQSVRGHAGGLAAEVVATLVGNDDAKSSGGQRLNLLAPPVPEFREAMEQKDNGAVFRACSHRVQAHCAILE